MDKTQANNNIIRGGIILMLPLVFALFFVSCKEEVKHPYADITREYFDSIATNDNLTISTRRIHHELVQLRSADKDSLNADVHTRKYYIKHKNDLLWVNRLGVKEQADTLLVALDSAYLDGFNEDKLHIKEIRESLERIRNLEYTSEQSISKDLATVEFYCTKAFLRYAVGMRYGITNPNALFNKLDIREQIDSVHATYRRLYDISSHIVGKQTFATAFNTIRHDSVGIYLRQGKPTSPLYWRLRSMLKDARGEYRTKILINMERARWRAQDYPEKHNEYIIVNVPSYHLWATRDGNTMTMKVCCGDTETKTPLLYSQINKMELNPQWIIPNSIAKSLARHAGDGGYFERHNYFIVDRKSGQKLDGYHASYSAIINGDQWIVQKGGEGNSLGRIIFRFPNKFSVYLHDTSSRSAFDAQSRAVSHGCVRVEMPYELACFMLRDDNEMMDRVKYSMESDLESEDIDKDLLVSNVEVKPNIPVYIVYYTLFLSPKGTFLEYPDVYGYDEVMAKAIEDM